MGQPAPFVIKVLGNVVHIFPHFLHLQVIGFSFPIYSEISCTSLFFIKGIISCVVFPLPEQYLQPYLYVRK